MKTVEVHLIIWTTLVRTVVKIALNVIKASKLVQMKFITQRSKLGLGGLLKSFYFYSYTNMVTSDKGISLKRKILEKV